MKKIDISITKARIISYSIDLNEKEPEVTATIGLYTGNDKKISTFELSTKTFYDQSFELPVEMIKPILEIAKKLETILVRECSSSIGYLEAKNEK